MEKRRKRTELRAEAIVEEASLRTWDGDGAREQLVDIGACRVEVVKYVAALSRFVLRVQREADGVVFYAVLTGCAAYRGLLQWASSGLVMTAEGLSDQAQGVVVVGSGLVLVELEPGDEPPELAR